MSVTGLLAPELIMPGRGLIACKTGLRFGRLLEAPGPTGFRHAGLRVPEGTIEVCWSGAGFGLNGGEMPDSSDYLARIRELAGAGDPVVAQAHAPSAIDALMANVADERLKQRPAPDKWSVAEILAHLAEDEIATAWRYRQMVENSGVSLAGFDQDLWARLGKYSEREPQDSLALYRLLRETNVRFLKALSAEQWECFGIHAERGRISVRDLARHMVGHDLNHMEQIRKILS